MLQYFKSMSDHFKTLCIKGLTIAVKLSILDISSDTEYAFGTFG